MQFSGVQPDGLRVDWSLSHKTSLSDTGVDLSKDPPRIMVLSIDIIKDNGPFYRYPQREWSFIWVSPNNDGPQRKKQFGRRSQN